MDLLSHLYPASVRTPAGVARSRGRTGPVAIALAGALLGPVAGCSTEGFHLFEEGTTGGGGLAEGTGALGAAPGANAAAGGLETSTSESWTGGDSSSGGTAPLPWTVTGGQGTGSESAGWSGGTGGGWEGNEGSGNGQTGDPSFDPCTACYQKGELCCESWWCADPCINKEHCVEWGYVADMGSGRCRQCNPSQNECGFGEYCWGLGLTDMRCVACVEHSDCCTAEDCTRPYCGTQALESPAPPRCVECTQNEHCCPVDDPECCWITDEGSPSSSCANPRRCSYGTCGPAFSVPESSGSER